MASPSGPLVLRGLLFAVGVGLSGPEVTVAVASDAGDAVWRAWTFASRPSPPRASRSGVRTAAVAVVATLLASAASSPLLADAGVALVEAHTMPPGAYRAGVVGVRGALRSDHIVVAGGWAPVPGCLCCRRCCSWPTTRRTWRGSSRPCCWGCCSAAGHEWALQAPLAIGVGALVLAAATQHEVVTDVPRWVLLASGDVLLLWLSISYERQRLRLSAARRHLAAMR